MTEIPVDQIPQLSSTSVPMPAVENGLVKLADGRTMGVEAYQSAWNRLSEPFPPEWIEKLPRGGAMLDYIGHAGITMRLNAVDPGWTWEPAKYNEDGSPYIGKDGMWGRLTILGVTRLGFGDAKGKNPGPDAIKEIIGDFLRNSAMRFGVGTYLWSKSEASRDMRQGPPQPPAPPSNWDKIGMAAGKANLNVDQVKEIAVGVIETDMIENLNDDDTATLINAIQKKGKN